MPCLSISRTPFLALIYTSISTAPQMAKTKPKGAVSKRKFKELQKHIDDVNEDVLQLESAYFPLHRERRVKPVSSVTIRI
jgi:hypothetical protein